MDPTEQALRTSRARLEASERRMLRNAASESDACKVLQSTSARVKRSEELLAKANEKATSIVSELSLLPSFMTPQ